MRGREIEPQAHSNSQTMTLSWHALQWGFCRFWQLFTAYSTYFRLRGAKFKLVLNENAFNQFSRQPQQRYFRRVSTVFSVHHYRFAEIYQLTWIKLEWLEWNQFTLHIFEPINVYVILWSLPGRSHTTALNNSQLKFSLNLHFIHALSPIRLSGVNRYRRTTVSIVWFSAKTKHGSYSAQAQNETGS